MPKRSCTTLQYAAWIGCVLALPLGCASNNALAPVGQNTTRSVADQGHEPPQRTDSAEYHLAVVRQAGASSTDRRDRENSELWLLSHPKESYPLILAETQANLADLGLIRLLGRYRKQESTPTLIAAFAQDGWIQRYAATALARSPDPNAERFLLQTLEANQSAQVVAAIEALEVRNETRLCAHVHAKLQDPEPDIRWMALHTTFKLGCLTTQELANLTKDEHPRVRQLAKELTPQN